MRSSVTQAIDLANELAQSVSLLTNKHIIVIEPGSAVEAELERWHSLVERKERLAALEYLERWEKLLQELQAPEIKQTILSVVQNEIARLSTAGAADLWRLESALSEILLPLTKNN